ncbi:hypothetical protein [Sigmofec virus UA08Rod_5530]|uniref:Uncharacterized protein n=1 Tax=Sigmofec virus UA08Rod_5530 TaxID=2929427 RepID=A0A976N0P7_9VIRU|nr:hypothetical protein [Sigmofec virus UA08Rod_5530]
MANILTYRFFWKSKNDPEHIKFKIVSDTQAGLDLFEKVLCESEDVIHAGKEYLYEIDVSKMTVIVPVKNENFEKEADNNEA